MVLGLAAISFPAVAVAGWFGPDDYDECILKHMKGVNGRRAAGVVHRSCRNKFPDDSESRDRSGWFGSDDYDECILKYMKGVNGRHPTGLVHRSCRNKFPDDSD